MQSLDCVHFMKLISKVSYHGEDTLPPRPLVVARVRRVIRTWTHVFPLNARLPKSHAIPLERPEAIFSIYPLSSPESDLLGYFWIREDCLQISYEAVRDRRSIFMNNFFVWLIRDKRSQTQTRSHLIIWNRLADICNNTYYYQAKPKHDWLYVGLLETLPLRATTSDSGKSIRIASEIIHLAANCVWWVLTPPSRRAWRSGEQGRRLVIIWEMSEYQSCPH